MKDLWVTWNACGSRREWGLHSVPSKVRLETFPGARYEWVPRECLVSNTQLVRPLWDCLSVVVLVRRWVVPCSERVVDQGVGRWTLQGMVVVS